MSSSIIKSLEKIPQFGGFLLPVLSIIFQKSLHQPYHLRSFLVWPTFDAAKLVKTDMTIVVSINGKRSADFTISADADEPTIIATARDVVSNKLSGAEIIKTVVVPNKLVNFVIKK